MLNRKKIVVTMTFWEDRICDCSQVMQSVLDNTVKPDIIFLNLFKGDFPNKINGLPDDLTMMIMRNPLIKVNWIGNDVNRYLGFKGILDKDFLDIENDIVIHIDDVVPKSYIAIQAYRHLFGGMDNGKHDVVLLYSKNGVHSQAQTNGEKLEVEYVIASLRKFCSSWLGRIIIVGDKLEGYDDTIHIQVDDVYKTTKAANIWNKIREAIIQIDDLTNEFVFVSDDQIVVKETTFDDIVPCYSRIHDKDNLVRNENDYIEHNIKKNVDDQKWEINWQRISYRTFRKFFTGDNCVYQMQPHIWMRFDKFKFLNMCELYDYVNDIGCLIGTTYYNTFGCEKHPTVEHIYIGTNRTEKYIRRITPQYLKDMDARWLCWTDNAFQYNEFRKCLDEITFGEQTI